MKKRLLIGGSILTGALGVALGVKAITRAKKINNEIDEEQIVVDSEHERHEAMKETMENENVDMYTEEDLARLQEMCNEYTETDYENDCQILKSKRIASHIVNITPAIVMCTISTICVVKTTKMKEVN